MLTDESQIGRIILGAMFVALGLESLFTGHLPAGLIPVAPPGLPLAAAWALGVGVALAALACIALPRIAYAPLVLAAFPALALLTIHIPRLIAAPTNPQIWTSGLELVALGGGALLLSRLHRVGRLLVAAALLGFGIQHYMYANFVAGLIPAWMPARVGLAYLTGSGFIAAGLAFAAARMVRLAARLLALQFGIFVVTLHIPRIVAAGWNEAEWSSGFIALAMVGIALLIAGGVPRPLALYTVSREAISTAAGVA